MAEERDNPSTNPEVPLADASTVDVDSASEAGYSQSVGSLSGYSHNLSVQSRLSTPVFASGGLTAAD